MKLLFVFDLNLSESLGIKALFRSIGMKRNLAFLLGEI